LVCMCSLYRDGGGAVLGGGDEAVLDAVHIYLFIYVYVYVLLMSLFGVCVGVP
jgi:hypothetical protein